MRAVAIKTFGGIEQVEIMDLPCPHPEDSEVQVKIAYSGVNPVDWKIREGMIQGLMPHEFPLILGWEMAGTVTNVGSQVKSFKPGDKVWGYCRKDTVQWGTHTEYVCANEDHLAHLPKSLSFAEAAAIPLTGLTAWQSLFDFADLEEGQTILIHAGAGGVGSMAIQIAKHIGAKVITTASAKNHAYCKSLGADTCIDYTTEDVSARIRELCPQGLDALYDCIGGEALYTGYDLVKRGGVLVTIVEPPDENRATTMGIKAGFVFVEPNASELTQIGKLFDDETFQVPNLEEMPLENARHALEKVRAGHTVGKIVLKVE